MTGTEALIWCCQNPCRYVRRLGDERKRWVHEGIPMIDGNENGYTFDNFNGKYEIIEQCFCSRCLIEVDYGKILCDKCKGVVAEKFQFDEPTLLMDEYQKEAAKTAIYPREHAVTYPIIGLANESGEALGKLKKVLRGDKTIDEQRESIIDECGDVFWYLANTASDLGISLSELARRNLDKLRKRKESGTLQGDGDKR